MKKLSALLLMALVIAGCGSNDAKEVSGEGTAAVGENGDKVSVSLTMKGDEVVDISIDETKEGKSKKEQKYDYNMKDASGIQKEWFEQIEFLEDYIKENGIDAVELDKKTGKPTGDDVLAGCTINLTTIMEAVNNAAENAK